MTTTLLERYLSESGKALSEVPAGFQAYLANLDQVRRVCPQVARAIVRELEDQRSNIKLIASENYCSLPVQSGMANLLTDKYAEGFPYKRFYAGCDNVDEIEEFACRQARELFGAEHAYVQPHSGADANLIAFWAILSARVEEPAIPDGSDALSMSAGEWEQVRAKLSRQRLLGMDLSSGGHLTHGFRRNVSGKMFESSSYAVDPETSQLDYDALERQAEEVRPLILLAGYSAYPRRIDFRRMRRIADSVGAVLMVDMAHFAGLVAGKVFEGDYDPVPHAQVVTTTTHKTLRGPRGGLILCTKEFADFVDKGCPLVQGGPLPHVMAAKAVCFTEAGRPEFQGYARRIVDNARALAAALTDNGCQVVSGGTDNHLVLVDVRPYGITGRQAEIALRECGVTLNRNTIPFDPNGAWYTSGLRLGTPAVTTLGMSAGEMGTVARLIAKALSHTTAAQAKSGKSKAKYHLDEAAAAEVRREVEALLARFPLYPEIELDFLVRATEEVPAS